MPFAAISKYYSHHTKHCLTLATCLQLTVSPHAGDPLLHEGEELLLQVPVLLPALLLAALELDQGEGAGVRHLEHVGHHLPLGDHARHHPVIPQHLLHRHLHRIPALSLQRVLKLRSNYRVSHK